jgi:hypothetical protein
VEATFLANGELPNLRYEIPAVVDEGFVQSSFRDATEQLKQRASYIWRNAKDERDLTNLSIGTWARRTSRSEILKHGTQEDKARLPAATARNKTDTRKRTFTIYGDARADGRRIRVNKVANRRTNRVVAQAEIGVITNDFANAFK